MGGTVSEREQLLESTNNRASRREGRWGSRTRHIILEEKGTVKRSEARKLEWEEGCPCKLFLLSTHAHS